MKNTTQNVEPMEKTKLPRRHEIDALRSIALLLLIFYHALLAFQPTAAGVMFIGSSETLEQAWFIGEFLNSWRIPVLFLISGITAGYLLQNRSVAELLKSRLLRLVPPLIFTCLVVAPISPALFMEFHDVSPSYIPNPGHLWFVWNLAVYFVISFPLLLLLKHRPDNGLTRMLGIGAPYSWLVALPVFLTALTWTLEQHITADMFSIHFMRFWYGFGCFLSGLVLVALGDEFWSKLRNVGWVALPIMILLYILRMNDFTLDGRFAALQVRTLESVAGMLAFLGLGSMLFTKPVPAFSFLNRAVFAVYILHMPIQQAIGFWLFRTEMNPWIAFPLHLLATLVSSLAIYWLVLRPLTWIHPVFGIALPKSKSKSSETGTEEADTQLDPLRLVGRFSTLYLVTPIIVLAAMLSVIAQTGQLGERENSSAPAMPLIEAAAKGNTEAIRVHIAAGSDLNQREPMNRSTALITAVTLGNDEAALALIAGGADLELRNNEGSTALLVAAFLCRERIVEALLANGADKTVTNNAGSTALDSVTVPFEAVRPVYDFLQATLGPTLGLRLDYERIQISRPIIAAMLLNE